MGIKLAVRFNEETIRQHKFHCVKCGQELSDYDAEISDQVGLPPCCKKDESDVIDEVSKDFPIYPSGWYGHAWRDSIGNWWANVSMPKVSQS